MTCTTKNGYFTLLLRVVCSPLWVVADTEFMTYVSPDVRYQTLGQSPEKRMLEVRARLVFLLERNINSRLFETDGGFLGMGSKYCEQGDIV